VADEHAQQGGAEESLTGEEKKIKKKKKSEKDRDNKKSHIDQESPPRLPTNSTLVYTGLPEKTRLQNISIPENTRVTLKFRSSDPSQGADPVDPSTPREEAGYYWGYTVRRCDSLSAVFTESPFPEGYDLSFGTSERGTSLADVLKRNRRENGEEGTHEPIPKFKHLIIVFGGVAGLEASVKVDKELMDRGVKPGDAHRVFDYWVNVLPGQGSRTIRTEEAVWLGLMGLRGLVLENQARLE